MKEKAIVIGPPHKRYRLSTYLIEPVNAKTGRLSRYGAFTMRGEVRRMLSVLTGVVKEGAHGYGTHLFGGYRSHYVTYDYFTAALLDGQIRFGCTRFSKADSKKLAKWAGVTI